MKNNSKEKVLPLRIETSLKKDYLKQMIELDSDNYTEDNAGVYDTCMLWYKKNPKIYTIALRGGKVVGYINFTPITNDAYDKFKKGLISDSDLKKEHIMPFKVNKEQKCLFMSIVVSEQERGGEVTKSLTQHFKNRLKKLNKKGYLITSILADCVSANGEKYMKRLGFDKVLETDRNSIIYEIDFSKNLLK